MDVETLVNVGSYCETLISDPTFQFLSGSFEQSAVGELLATKPHETKLRESIYARVTAHREFISHLVEYIQKKHDAEAPAPDQTEVLDDPSVHNIYEGID